MRVESDAPSSSAAVLALLRRFESRNVTYQDAAHGWPAVWDRARGCTVWDVEGRRYLDLTAAFGVAAAGHANPRVVAAGRRQLGRLTHAMGDVHPHPGKARLVQELSRLTFGRWRRGGVGKTVLGNSGFEAVEIALKTARLATGRPGVVAFEGGYHGLGYGALNVTHRGHFRDPFQNQLGGFGRFVGYPSPEAVDWQATLTLELDAAAASGEIGAVLVEPMQARGGIRIPPAGFLARLRAWCDRRGALLVLDEIYTGFGRTGRWFACDHARVTPDLICLGKALTGGFPLSACVGRAEVMDAAWPESDGEAIHTSTFLGHPVGCAMALAQLGELRSRRLPALAAQRGHELIAELKRLPPKLGKYRLRVRGVGLMVGLVVEDEGGRPATNVVIAAMKRLLREGILILPEGPAAEVLAFTPPLTISPPQIRNAVRLVGRVLRELCE